MPTRPLVKPRKNAAQARSRATVDALVEATARILVRDGFDRASTNRIADEAGVSVGSLYQYYPGKAALVAAVMERHQGQLMQVVRAAMTEVEGRPLAVGVRRLVAAAIDGHRVDPALHRVLAEQIPHSGPAGDFEAFSAANYSLFRGYLEAHREEVRCADLDLATFLCVTSIEAVTHTAVLHRPDMLSDAAAAALVDEATRLVLGYLRHAPV